MSQRFFKIKVVSAYGQKTYLCHVILRAGRDKCTHLRRAKCVFVTSPIIPQHTAQHPRHQPASCNLLHTTSPYTHQPIRHLPGPGEEPAASQHICCERRTHYTTYQQDRDKSSSQQPPPTPSTMFSASPGSLLPQVDRTCPPTTGLAGLVPLLQDFSPCLSSPRLAFQHGPVILWQSS